MSVIWQKEFAIGVIEIDRQHQELFSKLNDLLAAIESSGYQAALARAPHAQGAAVGQA